MKLGIAGLCPGIEDRLLFAKSIGYDFFETALFRMEMDGPDVRAFIDAALDSGLPCVSTNGMFPSDIKLIGKDADRVRISEYLNHAYEVIAPLKTEVCVLGSGGARTVDPEYGIDRAYDEFASLIAEVIAPITEKYGKTLAIEPLNYSECNIVNTVADSMRVVRAVNRPSVMTLIDYYHVRYNGENIESFVDYAGHIRHVHVASFNNHRRYPRPGDGEDYAGFFGVLRRACYDGTVSIEADGGAGYFDFCASAIAAKELLINK